MEHLPKDIIRLLLGYLGIDSYESFSCTAKFVYNAVTKDERLSRTDIRYCVENNRIQFLKYYNVDALYYCAMAYNTKLLDYLPSDIAKLYYDRNDIMPNKTIILQAAKNSLKYNHIEHLKAIPKEHMIINLSWLTEANREVLEYVFENNIPIEWFCCLDLLKAKPSVIKFILENWKASEHFGYEVENCVVNYSLGDNFRFRRVIRVLYNHMKIPIMLIASQNVQNIEIIKFICDNYEIDHIELLALAYPKIEVVKYLDEKYSILPTKIEKVFLIMKEKMEKSTKKIYHYSYHDFFKYCIQYLEDDEYWITKFDQWRMKVFVLHLALITKPSREKIDRIIKVSKDINTRIMLLQAVNCSDVSDWQNKYEQTKICIHRRYHE